MTEKILKATHIGKLEIDGLIIPCAVLEDGQRILTETGISKAFKSRSGSSRLTKKIDIELGRFPLPIFVASKRLTPFISNELMDGLLNPVQYKIKTQVVKGYPAEYLPKICDVWLKARDANILHASQLNKAKNAEIIIRALAHLGIIALVDEATGYQEIRDKDALQKILDKYLLKEYAEWAKRFPDEFYQEIFRLNKWQWKGMKLNRPSIVGTYTNDIVYKRLAPGVLEELKKLNPPDEKGIRKIKHHQFLTQDIGHPALQRHIYAVIILMKASSSWRQFHVLLAKAFPQSGDQMPFDFDE